MANEESENIPKWIRYLPSNKIIPTKSLQHALEPSKNKLPNVLVHSCNKFGPTSLHALEIEKPISLKNKKRLISSNQSINKIETDIAVESDKVKLKRRRISQEISMAEASKLFSIVDIK